ncbi:MAG TPA: DUF58 domain-containing protein [Anaeromyxobacteraceae bacterium]|nr:DUF58 domain-containing protein [Anaeromyxobacteraceae bacterium]
MKLDLARLNHVLIPATKDGRDRLRQSRLGRALRPLERLFAATTPDGRLFLTLALLAGVFGLDARRTEAHFLFALFFAAVAASVLVGRRLPLTGARLEVLSPRAVAVGEEVSFRVSCANPSGTALPTLHVRRPFLPYDGTWVEGSPLIGGVAPRGRGGTELRARFRQRGEHHLDPFGVGVLVPFGLAVGPLLESPGVRFVVVPRVANLARLTLPLGRRYQSGGVALASKTGDSTEFLGVRPYRPGDAVRDLHARSSARAGLPVVRERQQEFFSRVAVILDAELGGAPPRALEAALSLTAGLVAHLTRGESLVDLAVASEPRQTLRLGRSLGHLDQALELLACVARGAPLVPEALLARLDLRPLSGVVLVGLGFTDAHRRFAASVRAAGVGCRVLLVGEAVAGEATAVPVAAIERGEALLL